MMVVQCIGVEQHSVQLEHIVRWQCFTLQSDSSGGGSFVGDGLKIALMHSSISNCTPFPWTCQQGC